MHAYGLDSAYDDFAKDIADLQKCINVVNKKLKEFKKEIDVNVNRLTLYVKNQFFEQYDYSKYCFLFRRDNKIEFYLNEEIELARKKFEELKQLSNDTWLLDELEMFDDSNEIIVIDRAFNSKPSNDEQLEPFYKTYDNLKKYLPKTGKTFKINQQQKSQLKTLVLNCDNPKFSFLLEKLKIYQEQYFEIIDQILEMLSESGYDFDIETDNILTVRDDEDMSWHLVIEKMEE